jgi:hypothetical protein
MFGELTFRLGVAGPASLLKRGTERHVDAN